jgi:hypothetical protein
MSAESTLLAGWDNYYVILGSSAGGLTGLTFVVIALVRDAQRVSMKGLNTYVTPTIVHFGGVLALAAFFSMPHQHPSTVSVGLAVGGLAGIIYSALLARNMPRVGIDYVPVREDWVFNVILPGVLYAGLVLAAWLIWLWPQPTLYGVALIALVLLFMGIRNAWDIAVWMTTHPTQPGGGDGGDGDGSSGHGGRRTRHRD